MKLDTVVKNVLAYRDLEIGSTHFSAHSWITPTYGRLEGADGDAGIHE